MKSLLWGRQLWASTSSSSSQIPTLLSYISTKPTQTHFNGFGLPSAFIPCLCFSSSSSAKAGDQKKKLVFLGTPKVAAQVLNTLLDVASQDHSSFEVSAIVTQPPAPRGRGKKNLPSPVAELAMERNFPTNLILSPVKASEQHFLEELRKVEPDLCLTAAYGNFLPKKFLEIPKKGTINIHPSLLPLYRGAAPIQRALQDGAKETGVTVAYTVHAMDAGPIITSKSFQIDDAIKAPQLLEFLFKEGTQLFLKELPSILDGSTIEKAQEQDHSCATNAPKVTADEAWLNFEDPAIVLHNKVRAFADWPGTKARFQLCGVSGEVQQLDLKIVTTRVHSGALAHPNDDHTIPLLSGALVVPCGCGSALEILELQPPGKRVMSARDFFNGLRGQQLTTSLKSGMNSESVVMN